MTLDRLRTRTEVAFCDDLAHDQVTMNGQDVTGRPLSRVAEMLERIRTQSAESRKARVVSLNNFPTAAGLASSASGFAALAVAAAEAAQLSLSTGQLSAQARKSSASAARSLFEGFCELGADTDEATPLFPKDHWAVAMVVAVIGSGPKSIGSTGGMLHTKETSPYYPAWETVAPAVFGAVKQGVAGRDFSAVASAMEHSTRLMHATMMTSEPPVTYLRGPTIELMHAIEARRTEGHAVAYTMDAGPNVKVLTTADELDDTATFVARQPGVEATIVCLPGPAASLLEPGGELEDAARVDGLTLSPFEPLTLGQAAPAGRS